MADARAHEPKLKALAAYDRGELSGAGRSRMDRHLSRCDACRAALAGRRRYAALLEHALAAAAPEPGWARMQPMLQREADRARRRTRLRWVVPAAVAAAACLAVVVGQRLRAPLPRPSGGAPAAAVRVDVAAPAAPLAVRVSALVGRAEIIDAGGRRFTINLDSTLQEGWSVETFAGSEVHLVLGGVAAVLLADDSRLVLGRAREGDVVLALERGRVISAVRPLPVGSRYRVEALGHEVAVRGTHFSVEQHPSGLGVQVDEGWVSVLRDGVLVADLRAPQRWLQADAKSHAAGSGTMRLARPREPAAGFERWPVLHVPAWPRVAGWEIDSARVGGGGELAMRVPPGDLDIDALLQNGGRMRGRIHVDALGARFDPRGLELIGPVSDRPPAEADADPTQAVAVIRAAQSELQRCYERSLRNGPGGALAARLHLQIDGQGRVRKAELSASEELPAVLTECIRAVAGRWQFPPPGGAGIAFEAPIRFQPRQ